MNRLIYLAVYCFLFLSCSDQRKIRQSENVRNTLIMLDRVCDESRNSTLIDKSGKIIKDYPYFLVKPLADGNFLGKEDTLLVKFSASGKVLWKSHIAIEPHHEIVEDASGKIYVFSSEVKDFMGLKVRFDGFQILSPSGEMLYSWSVYDHLEEFVAIVSKSAWTKHLPRKLEQCKSVQEYIAQDPSRFIVPTDSYCDCDFEFTHFNAMQLLPENKLSKTIPAFTKGNILMSFHPYSCYGIISPTTGKFEWVGYLPERTRLHATSFTSNETILVFQNATDSSSWLSRSNYADLRSQFLSVFKTRNTVAAPEPRYWTSITEYNPVTNEKVWEYTATPKESLKVISRGSAQRLKNGNTLICTTTEEVGGRVFEITPSKKVVWDYTFPKNDPQKNTPWGYYRAIQLP